MQLSPPARCRFGLRIFLISFVFFVGVSATPLRAQDQDEQRRILDLRSQHQAIARERELLKDELNTGRPTIVVDGKAYTVGHNVSDVGRALYLSIQHKQWGAVKRFLDQYLTLPDRDPLLMHYGQGTLARLQGRHAQAIYEFRELLELKPDFLPGRLELARVLFEDQQDREAGQAFDAVAAAIDDDDPKTAGVRKTVATFQRALANRHGWNGSFALGPTWNDNLNRSSAGTRCWAYIGEICWITQTTPTPVVSAGYDYDANLNRRWQLRGHHGLYLRSLLFGQGYRDNSSYNELTSTTQAGYSYRSGRHATALAPSFDYFAWGNNALYAAWGAHAEWSWTMSPASLLKLEGDWKDLRYRGANYAALYDGITRSAYATYFRSLGPRWTVFGGVDVTDNAAAQEVYGYLQKGVRLGASLQWPAGIGTTLLASRRWRDYDAYSALLGHRRDDREDNVTLIVKATRWTFAGFTPLLALRYNLVKSNVDWLYTYDKRVVSLKLERMF